MGREMLITPRRRRWLRLLGTWPLVYVCAFVIGFYSLDFRAGSPPAPEVLIPALFVVHLGTVLLAYVVLVTCLIYLVGSGRFAVWKKVIWGVLLVLATIVVMPVFVWWQMRADAAVPERSERRPHEGVAAEQADAADEAQGGTRSAS